MKTCCIDSIFNPNIEYAKAAAPRVHLFRCNPKTNNGIQERIVSQFCDGQINILNIPANRAEKTREVTNLQGLKEKYGITLNRYI